MSYDGFEETIKLLEENQAFKATIKEQKQEILRLEAQLAKQRTVLEVFADIRHWSHNHWTPYEWIFSDGAINPQKLADDVLRERE